MLPERFVLIATHVLQLASIVVIAAVLLKLELPATLSFSSSTTIGTYSENLLEKSKGKFIRKTLFAFIDYTALQAYDRIVIMLVDALRSDMILDRVEMSYTRRLINYSTDLKGVYTSYAHNPTVTMPRIKAMVTGSIPNFIDVLNNIDSKALEGDHLIERFKQSRKRMVFYGDETWLKLFPSHFFRSDGTSSFFTKDFTIVDDNVTRHLQHEFDPKLEHPKSKDWDICILHYLGLDHIGHQHGPDSIHMHNKLREMDGIVEIIHKSLMRQESIRKRKFGDQYLPSLFVLLSDHGMNKQGNHGGSTTDETSAITVFQHVEARSTELLQSRNVKNFERIMQIDLVPTIGLVAGVGIPTTNLGSIIKEVFPKHEYSKAVEANAQQLYSYAKTKNEGLDYQLEQLFLNGDFENFLSKSKSILLSSTSNPTTMTYEMLLLSLGMVGTLCSLSASMYHIGTRNFDKLLMFGILLHPWVLTSSSFIENEHAYWFHFMTTWVMLKFVSMLPNTHRRNQQLYIIIIICVLRVLRSRLQIINFAMLTGIKVPEVIDEGTAVLVLHPIWKHKLTVIIALLLNALLAIKQLNSTFSDSQGRRILGYVCVILSLAFLMTIKAVSEPQMAFLGMSETFRARMVFLCILLMLFCMIFSVDLEKRRILMWTALTNLILLLQRSDNTIIVTLLGLLSLVGYKYARETKMHGASALLLFWSLGQCGFFALGNSHAIATMDISGAYTGLSEYVFVVVFILTGVILFSGNLLPICQGIIYTKESFTKNEEASLLWLFVCLNIYRMGIMNLVLILMRDHLFVWTVFAPKWVYEFLSTLMVIFVSHVLM